MRLPNSIRLCASLASVGVYVAAVQRGHVGQPSPESVSRTAPPVTTIPALATTLANASRRTVRAVGRSMPFSLRRARGRLRSERGAAVHDLAVGVLERQPAGGALLVDAR